MQIFYRSLLVCAVVAAASFASAEPKGDDKGKDKPKSTVVDVQVMSIRATTKNSDVSPELKALAEKLKKDFKYTGYKLADTKTGRAELDKSVKLDLPASYKTDITPKRRDGNKITLEVAISKGDKQVSKSTITVTAGQSYLIGGLKYDADDALILAISAK